MPFANGALIARKNAERKARELASARRRSQTTSNLLKDLDGTGKARTERSKTATAPPPAQKETRPTEVLNFRKKPEEAPAEKTPDEQIFADW
jgi:hypothetical protein